MMWGCGDGGLKPIRGDVWMLGLQSIRWDVGMEGTTNQRRCRDGGVQPIIGDVGMEV